MSKTSGRPQTRYVCQACGESFLRWEGQCRSCSAWNSLVETQVRTTPRAARVAPAGGSGTRGGAAPVTLADVGEPDQPRLAVGIPEMDRVLGGGLVPGSLVLVGGEPGIGKSTLLLQAAAGIAERAGPLSVLYATGEESTAQVRLRADRLGLLSGPAAGIRILAESAIDRIAEVALAEPPALLVVDSVQTATIDDLDGPAGSVGQVRGAALRLMQLAKPEGIAVVLVGHVTKDGTIAGPKTLEHLVDAVLTLEGERYAAIRLLRASKNRFGSTEEVGVFEMGEHGLSEVADPARAFLAEHDGPAPGSVIAPTLEGSRPLLVEVQALVAPGPGGTPRRTASGVDPNRVALLVAVLARRAGIGLASHDIYVNLAGGLSVDEPGLDLPLALALASSLRDRPIRPGTVAIGEVGLLGELRSVAGVERRLREAARLGFDRAIVPRPARSGAAPTVPGLEIVAVGSLREAIEVAFAAGPAGHAGQAGGAASADRSVAAGSARC
ncbi:MAG TPA: DNA repair protein RadA [Candidatus Limnocylindrales bacterium]|nr:DNA repair protein RadA [Candidatus Limnocylindrales bacterium]